MHSLYEIASTVSRMCAEELNEVQIYWIDNVGWKPNWDYNPIAFSISSIMKYAIPMRRAGLAESRADAVEMAYDFLLKRNSAGCYRTGEVVLYKDKGYGAAVCHIDLEEYQDSIYAEVN